MLYEIGKLAVVREYGEKSLLLYYANMFHFFTRNVAPGAKACDSVVSPYMHLHLKLYLRILHLCV